MGSDIGDSAAARGVAAAGMKPLTVLVVAVVVVVAETVVAGESGGGGGVEFRGSQPNSAGALRLTISRNYGGRSRAAPTVSSGGLSGAAAAHRSQPADWTRAGIHLWKYSRGAAYGAAVMQRPRRVSGYRGPALSHLRVWLPRTGSVTSEGLATAP